MIDSCWYRELSVLTRLAPVLCALQRDRVAAAVLVLLLSYPETPTARPGASKRASPSTLPAVLLAEANQ